MSDEQFQNRSFCSILLYKVVSQFLLYQYIMPTLSKPVSVKNQAGNLLNGILRVCPKEINTLFTKEIKIKSKINSLFFLLMMCDTLMSENQFCSLQKKINIVFLKKISFKKKGQMRNKGRYTNSLAILIKYQTLFQNIFQYGVNTLSKWKYLVVEAIKQQNWVNPGIQKARLKLRQEILEEWDSLLTNYQPFFERVKLVYGDGVSYKEILSQFLSYKEKAELQIQIQQSSQPQLIIEIQQDREAGENTGNPDVNKTEQIWAFPPEQNQKLVFIRQFGYYEFDQCQKYMLPADHPYIEFIITKQIYESINNLDGESYKPRTNSNSVSSQRM